MKNMMLFLGALALSLLIAELGLRLSGFSYASFYRYDGETGAALREGARGRYRLEGEAYVHINDQGMRDDREISVRKPVGVYRIAILGDSYAEAFQVDVEHTFWRKLERMLNACRYAPDQRIEVLNFGVSGYSTAQELVALRTRVRRFEPDLVLLAFLSGNDVRDNSGELQMPRGAQRPIFRLEGGRLVEEIGFRESRSIRLKSSAIWRLIQRLSDYSRVIQLFNMVKNVVRQQRWGLVLGRGEVDVGLDDHVYLSNPPAEWQRAWRVTEALIVAIKQETERQRARFVLVSLSNPGQVPPRLASMRDYAARLGEPDLFHPERRIETFARRERINLVLLARTFAEHAIRNRTYLHGFPNTVMGSGHWNERGHGLAAEQIAQFLCESKRSVPLPDGCATTVCR